MLKKTLRRQEFFAALPSSWKQPLEPICNTAEIAQLEFYLEERKKAGAQIFPAKKDRFAALELTPFDKVSILIIGQDPYHKTGQAHGLSFSVPAGVKVPPSLRNIYKELSADIGTPISADGTLTGWARQGVLLLNAILTVEENKPAAHAGRGWELFTDAILEQLLKRDKPLVVMLWGAYAQKKIDHVASFIDQEKHLVLKAAHPSPLSARGFLGCKHFSKAYLFLKQHGLSIDWSDLK